jgi:hypothetical protein
LQMLRLHFRLSNTLILEAPKYLPVGRADGLHGWNPPEI